MIQNYLKIGCRNLVKRKLYAFINIFGLALSISVCLVIGKYVEFELSYDNFHKNGDQIYRTLFTDYVNGEKQYSSPRFGFSLGPALLSDVPEIRTYVRIHGMGGDEAIVGSEAHHNESILLREKNILFADSTFLDVFTFNVIHGDAATALDNPSSIVLTRSTAQRYFGKELDVVGKTLHIVTKHWVSGDYTVTAVIDDVPQNSHLTFDFLVPLHNLLRSESYREHRAGWDWINFITYIVVPPGIDIKDVEAKMPPLLVKYTGPNSPGTQFLLTFDPVRNIHLHGNDDEESNYSSIYFFVLIAIFILLMAWINYINLATARATSRAKEVGVKKAMGVGRNQLIHQFMVESMLINLLSLVLAVILGTFLLSILNKIVDKHLSFDFTSFKLWAFLITLFFAGSFVSGIYPAFILSSFKPAKVIKGNAGKFDNGFPIRKVLVVFQFAASLILIAGTFTVYRQITFMRHYDKGFSMDHMLIVNGPKVIEENGSEERLMSFKNELLKMASVSHVASSDAIPGAGFSLITGMWKQGASVEKTKWRETIYIVRTDPDFINTYQIKLKEGRLWDSDFNPDINSVLINEAALARFELGSPEKALSENLVISGTDTVSIIGVFKNVNWSYLKTAHEPMLLWPDKVRSKQFSIRLSGNIHGSIENVEQLYKKAFPGNPFDYYFLDDFFNNQYKSERQFGKIFGMFALLAVIIASLGLWGLTAFTTTQRLKEISIRKVLGATVESIMSLLSAQFLKLLIIASVIVFPVLWYGLNSWLDNFAFRISFTWDLYIIPALVLGLTALTTISFQVIRAANANPVNSLRNE